MAAALRTSTTLADPGPDNQPRRRPARRSIIGTGSAPAGRPRARTAEVRWGVGSGRGAVTAVDPSKMPPILRTAPALLAAASLASIVTAAPDCGAGSFPLDLGNTHCEGLPLAKDVNSSAECVAACCAAGDECETWQWCEAGQACATGYWAQSGTLGRGSDLWRPRTRRSTGSS